MVGCACGAARSGYSAGMLALLVLLVFGVLPAVLFVVLALWAYSGPWGPPFDGD